MTPATTIDPSRRLDFPFRLRRAGSKKFIFLDENGTAIDISGYGFVLNIKEYPGARTNVISLTVGSGLTVGGAGNNELTASLTVANTSVQEQEYYWELYKGSTSKTYLNGLAPAHNGVFDGVSNDQDTLTITDGSSEVTINISDSVSGGGGGSGDVVGPSTAVDGHGVVFDGTTGKLIRSLEAAPVPTSRTIAGLDLSTNRTVLELQNALYVRAQFSHYFNDFVGNAAGDISTNQTSGAGASNGFGTTFIDAGHPGIARTTTGTTTTGKSVFNWGAIATKGGTLTFETAVYLSTAVSDSTDRYIIYAGLVNTYASESSDQIVFKYSDDINSGRWQGVTTRNGSSTTVNGGALQAVIANTWFRLTFVVNAGATSVEFFVNGVSIGSSTGTIPQESIADMINPCLMIRKTAGTNSRIADWDYILLNQSLTVSR